MSLNDTLKKLLLTAAQEALWSFGTEYSARCEHCGWRSTWTPEELMKVRSLGRHSMDELIAFAHSCGLKWKWEA